MKTPRIPILIGLAALSAVLRTTEASAAISTESFQITTGIADNAATVTIAGQVYKSDTSICNLPRVQATTHTVVALHGLAHTAATWQGFAEALLSPDTIKNSPVTIPTLRRPETFLGKTICRVITFDMPGRGPLAESGITVDELPSGVFPSPASLPSSPFLFRNLRLRDYAAIANGVMNGLRDQGLLNQKVTLVGHSLGALVWQLAEQELQNEGKSLRNLGVDSVAFLASSIPVSNPKEALPWSFANVYTQMALNPFHFALPHTGFVYGLPDSYFRPIFMSDKATTQFLLLGIGSPTGLTAPNPSDADIRNLKLNALEPDLVVYQLLRGGISQNGQIIYPPQVSPSLFRNFANVTNVIFSEDAFATPEEYKNLAKYLVGGEDFSTAETIGSEGDTTATQSLLQIVRSRDGSVKTLPHRLIEVTGPLAVHDFYLTEPAKLVKFLR